MHLVGFTIEIYHDARSHECQRYDDLDDQQVLHDVKTEIKHTTCHTFGTDIIIILTAASPQFLPLQVGGVLAAAKIVTYLLHIVQQQIGSIVSLTGWSLVRVHWVVKVVSICRQNP